MSLNWDASDADRALLQKITDRAVRFYHENGIALNKAARVDISMDLEAAHMNGNPLRLADLLGADDANFMHDVSGIRRHLDRATGELRDCFSPRFSDYSSATVEG